MAVSSSKATDLTTSVTPTAIGSGIQLTAGTKLSIGRNTSLNIRSGLSEQDRQDLGNLVSKEIANNSGASIFASNPGQSGYVPFSGNGGTTFTDPDTASYVSSKPPPDYKMQIAIGVAVVIGYFLTRN